MFVGKTDEHAYITARLCPMRGGGEADMCREELWEGEQQAA